ncbi:hypothetical protein [Allochromatium palmeri]|nr:hypothetical protein [Allochromatium palmeri]
MFTIKRTDAFAAWLDGLKDRATREHRHRPGHRLGGHHRGLTDDRDDPYR